MSNSAFQCVPVMQKRPPRLIRSSNAAWFLGPTLMLVAAVGTSFLVGVLDELPKSSQVPASAASIPAGG